MRDPGVRGRMSHWARRTVHPFSAEGPVFKPKYQMPFRTAAIFRTSRISTVSFAHPRNASLFLNHSLYYFLPFLTLHKYGIRCSSSERKIKNNERSSVLLSYALLHDFQSSNLVFNRFHNACVKKYVHEYACRTKQHPKRQRTPQNSCQTGGMTMFRIVVFVMLIVALTGGCARKHIPNEPKAKPPQERHLKSPCAGCWEKEMLQRIIPGGDDANHS